MVTIEAITPQSPPEGSPADPEARREGLLDELYDRVRNGKLGEPGTMFVIARLIDMAGLDPSETEGLKVAEADGTKAFTRALLTGAELSDDRLKGLESSLDDGLIIAGVTANSVGPERTRQTIDTYNTVLGVVRDEVARRFDSLQA